MVSTYYSCCQIKKLYVYGNLNSLLAGNHFKDLYWHKYLTCGSSDNSSYKRWKAQLFYTIDTYRCYDLSLFNTESANNIVNHPYKPLVYNGPESDLTFIEYPNLTIETNFQEKLWTKGDISNYSGSGKLILTNCTSGSDTKGLYIKYSFTVKDWGNMFTAKYDSFAIGNNIFSDYTNESSWSDEKRFVNDDFYFDAANNVWLKLYNGYSLDLGEDKEITFKTFKTS